MTPALVVGLGHPDRGDDAVGPAVARAVRSLGLPGLDVLEGTEPIELLDLWGGYAHVVVVDAVRSTEPPGTVRRWDPAGDPLPSAARTASSHALDLAGAVELARSLGRLPERLELVGVVGAGFVVGQPLSELVLAGVDEAVRAVVAAVASP